MKGFLTIAILTIYLILVAGDFILMPELLFIPASLVLSAGILLGTPYAIRRFASVKPLPLTWALAATLALLALVFLLFWTITPAKLHTFAIVSLVGLNGVFALLCLLLLTQEKQEQDDGVTT